MKSPSEVLEAIRLLVNLFLFRFAGLCISFIKAFNTVVAFIVTT